MSDYKMLGKIRGLNTDEFQTPGDEEVEVAVTSMGEQLITNAVAPGVEVSRIGRAFKVNTTSSVASVIALPTTAVTIALYNNEPDGGRSYIIDQVFAMFTTNSAAIDTVGIIGCLGQVREAIPANSALVVQNLIGGTKLDTRARTIIGGTALPGTTGFAGQWFPIGSSVAAAVTSLPGFQQTVDVQGRFIVMPGRYFALHTLGTVITISAQVGLIWHEKYLLEG